MLGRRSPTPSLHFLDGYERVRKKLPSGPGSGLWLGKVRAGAGVRAMLRAGDNAAGLYG